MATFGNEHLFQMIDNYVYLYHTDTLIIIPAYADSINDKMSAHFASSTPLSRSAPIYSYQNSGPRTIQVAFDLQRDLMLEINYSNSKAKTEIGDDYVDLMIKQIQAAALPVYKASDKMVDPPLVALRLGNDIFIKGVVEGEVGVTYEYPILDNGKYSKVRISFSVTEVTPYDAETVQTEGSFRGLSKSLERKIWRTA